MPHVTRHQSPAGQSAINQQFGPKADSIFNKELTLMVAEVTDRMFGTSIDPFLHVPIHGPYRSDTQPVDIVLQITLWRTSKWPVSAMISWYNRKRYKYMLLRRLRALIEDPSVTVQVLVGVIDAKQAQQDIEEAA